MSLSGKVCLVTGSSKGIGRGIALQLGGHGATVYVTGRSKDKLESCVEEINKRGGKGKEFKAKVISCSRHRTSKFPNSESPIFTTKFCLSYFLLDQK